MKTVMVFGSFDVMHPGHLYFLRQAKSKGDRLIAVVAQDSSIKKIKKFNPKYSEQQRMDHVRDVPHVDKAVLGYENDPYEIVEEINPDVICLGYDQTTYTENIEEELKKRNVKAEIIRIGAYREDRYKSSKLK